MARTEKTEPTPAELRILQVLWRQGASAVRQVHEELSRAEPTAHTTTLKLMQIMTDKGLLVRDDSRRPQVFRPARSRTQTQRGIVKGLLRRAFDGSAGQLVLQALASKKPSPEELAEIRRLLDELEGEQP